LWRAYGSSEETLEHLYFLFETESLKDQRLFQELSENYKHLNRMLFNYIQSVERTFETPAFLKEPSTEYQADSTVNDDPSEPPNLESLYPDEEP
jgi:hypothetical protein